MAAEVLLIIFNETPMSPESSQSSESLIDRLLAAYRDDLYALCVELGRKCRITYPSDWICWSIYGQALVKERRYSEGLEALRIALKHVDAEHRYHIQTSIGKTYEAKGDRKSAIAWYRRAIRCDKREPAPWIYLGVLYLLMGDFRLAKRVLKSALKSVSSCLDEVYFNLGSIYRNEDNLQMADHCYSRALEISPDYEIASHSLNDVRLAHAELMKGNTP